MKKGVFLILLIVLIPFSSAQGIMPDNSAMPILQKIVQPDSSLYSLELFIDEINLMMSLTKDAKSKEALEQAKERLEEAKAMDVKNNPKLAAKALKRHDALIKHSLDNIDSLSDEQKTEILNEINEEMSHAVDDLDEEDPNFNLEKDMISKVYVRSNTVDKIEKHVSQQDAAVSMGAAVVGTATATVAVVATGGLGLAVGGAIMLWNKFT